MLSSFPKKSLYRKLKQKLPDGMEDETRPRVPSVIWLLLFVFVMVMYIVDVFQIGLYSIHPIREQIREFDFDKKLHKGYLINTPGCRIPEMDPFDKNILKYIENVEKPKCNKGVPALYAANISSIYLINSSLSAYNITDITELKCCYKVFWRREPESNEDDNKITYSSDCYNLNGSSHINDEFIEVICTYENSTIYKDMFSFVPIKNFNRTVTTNPRPLNVLVVGLDAVSRLNLHRQMPKTVNYLKELAAVELLGYNKVGDNTFPNLIPVLTGMFESELRNSCWNAPNGRFDNCSYIWKQYKSKGYLTAYGEDASWMGLFNYLRRGFKKQTTDYAYNYFDRIADTVIGNEHRMNVEECNGARLVFNDLLEYIKKFVVTMDNNSLPYFSLFWGSSLSHDDLNKPKQGDEFYYNFFKQLHDNNNLENTVLIFMSDHGIRWGGIRQTYQGRMEERLPFLLIVLPKWYKKQYQKISQNLQRNARRLTTPFDLHETLVDLLHPFELTEDYLDVSNKSRGISLFRVISKHRTCEDAAITSHWCTCQHSKEIDRNSSIVIEAATFAVDSMNVELEGYAQCANLTLDSIANARLMTHSDELREDKIIQDYMITVKTVPGEGIFEVTVRHYENENTFDIIGTISRLNLYGKQSSCITDFHLKLYCFCKSLLNR